MRIVKQSASDRGFTLMMCLEREEPDGYLFSEREFAANYRISLSEVEASFRRRYVQILPEDWRREPLPEEGDDLEEYETYKNCWTKSVRGVEELIITPRKIV